MRITDTDLHERTAEVLDTVLPTGEPVEVERNGQLLRITPSKLNRLTRRDAIIGEPDDLVHMDWLAMRVSDTNEGS